MIVVHQISELKQALATLKTDYKSIGFVPTMGALHFGHISLVKAAKSENDFTVCSIFVNPEQFNNAEDLLKYPADLAGDIQLLEQAGCDLLFCPTKEHIYEEKPLIKFQFGILEEVMEGVYRKGHFSGMALIVAKLFHLVSPTTAYFGQKDLQQFRIIQKMVVDLSFDVQVKEMPIIRESDGLAMSSRNRRLTVEERKASLIFFQSLTKAVSLLKQQPIVEVKRIIAEDFKKAEMVELEYFEVVDKRDLQSIVTIELEENVAICIAGYVGNIRLIDNIYLIS